METAFCCNQIRCLFVVIEYFASINYGNSRLLQSNMEICHITNIANTIVKLGGTQACMVSDYCGWKKLQYDMLWINSKSFILKSNNVNSNNLVAWESIKHDSTRTDTWWRHQMETFSALLAICVGNSPVPGEFPAQRPVTRSFDVFFDLRPNKRLSKQWWGWSFETP